MNDDFPAGLIGEIADFILSAAPRPVPKIALAGAIGLMAGITGRAYNVSGTGLNQYLLMIAKTGRGKEAIAGGIAKLMDAVKASVPSSIDFIGPTEIASSQALLKWLARTPCFYSIVGEFGIKMREMSLPHAHPNVAGLKRTLLDLYNKSGKGNVQGAMAYSKRDENTAVVQSPAFTLLGESTPETVYENLNEAIISNGSLSRFSVVEYSGPRVPLNEAHSDAVPSLDLVRKLAELCAHCLSLGSRNQVCDILLSPDGRTIFRTFNEFCDKQINNDDQSAVVHELWNRAHIKAMKLAALYAVGEHYINPEIAAEHAQRAIDATYQQTVRLIAKFTNGETGAIEDNEIIRRSVVLKAIAHYCTTPYDKLPKYGASSEMHDRRIISQSYLQRRLGDTAVFRKAYGGATKALGTTIKNMIEADEIREIPKSDLARAFGTTMRSFVVSKPDAFLDPD